MSQNQSGSNQIFVNDHIVDHIYGVSIHLNIIIFIFLILGCEANSTHLATADQARGAIGQVRNIFRLQQGIIGLKVGFFYNYNVVKSHLERHSECIYKVFMDKPV